jgi:hypothetical protein
LREDPERREQKAEKEREGRAARQAIHETAATSSGFGASRKL